ncbi:MAG: cytochrome-c oxidase, cbb3-type subunit I [Candidatus Scalindua sp. AMX11]|nr:MAG: cytochrome-c oxidase, cbb3-type subunit I [Candidatus Scalindua sp.]NOG82391.1 cytochrome-c oxidase, cbb3-type subunit I [Planctomycetota bacterium]RZV70589.1 MAG: cytochrome-c oxidase, cbb3-type subunit I [Candidatus Scalindua sp. SCAELEC01]TDE64180.1 MAG: cytochrome-c oxidase, cbb3-type subunit I [Candidatus Scalindua sp. AMX11]GJQ60451.1 MAG: bifunctional cbb3-type cytochrome C oxidase subunit I/II [Candidatus Scalindua sp.]
MGEGQGIDSSDVRSSGYIQITYDDTIVRYFVLATLFWATIAFLVGLFVALQMSVWQLNFNISWLTFGRLRPLHTNAALLAFAGNAIFAGIYHSTQRLLKTRLFSDDLSRLHFWGWQFVIVLAFITLPLGFSQGKEYAELEWPIDIGIVSLWIVFAINFFGTLAIRNEKHMYVAIWFYIATIVTVAVLYVVNAISIPISLFKSYTIYAGIQDALIQWWYGHNAVAFFLTTPFLGLMYYYLPKAVNRPIYSYRLSVVHFWSLVFLYIWAGPHHLLNTALPEWLQMLAVIFSIMLWAPSWGGMVNGLLTLRGAWHLLRSDPIVKFLAAAIIFYGMVTFEGPLLSVKSVNSLGHFTDWIVGHVHLGTLGWNGFLTFGIVYYIVPKLWKTELFSIKMANIHFWLGILGILFYYVSMLTAGLTQGLMWRALDTNGRLVYPEFVETVIRIIPLYYFRAFGGGLFISGYALLLYNVYKTIRFSPGVSDETVQVKEASFAIKPTERGHRRLEGMVFAFTILAFVAIAVGSVIEIVPSLSVNKYVQMEKGVDPFSPLEIAGRDIYIREGCYACHSQMIRQGQTETLRYGAVSTIEESLYDRPFQWGSKRTGPDIARLGTKYPDLWHYMHMEDPRSVVTGSIMPAYPWLISSKTDFTRLKEKISLFHKQGVPYTEKELEESNTVAKEQAQEIAERLKAQGVHEDVADKEITALIAYLQALGQKGGQ